jgi:hypothetical protein
MSNSPDCLHKKQPRKTAGSFMKPNGSFEGFGITRTDGVTNGFFGSDFFKYPEPLTGGSLILIFSQIPGMNGY